MRESDIRPQALLSEFFVLLKADAGRLAAQRDEFVDVQCPFCADARKDVAFVKEGFDSCLCRGCRSLFVSRRPSQQALVEFAATSEALRFWSTHFYKQTAEARRREIFRPQAQLVAQLAKDHCDGQLSGCADVGAGYGLFLQEMSDLAVFPELVAIEPDERLATICRQQGFRVVAKWVEAVDETEVRVDFATAFEVIEHVFDPRGFVEACVSLLRPGGLFLLTTLTITGFDLQVLWEHSRSISPPQHLNFPSIAGMSELFKRCGLEVVSMCTPGQLDVDIVRNVLVASPELPVSRFARAVATAEADTRDAFQGFLQAHCLSSHLRCVVRKPA